MKRTKKATELVASSLEQERKEDLLCFDVNETKRIDTSEDFKLCFLSIGGTPIERLMGMKLFTMDIPFYFQYHFPLLDKGCFGRRYFILDFLLRDYNIVIECDGKVHNEPENVTYDKARSNFLVADGMAVLRFEASDIFSDHYIINHFIGEAIAAHPKIDFKERQERKIRQIEEHYTPVDIKDLPF